jgi:hypothetical protein
MIDFERINSFQIALGRLDKTCEVYTFYHDETNNIRKLHVQAHGLNVASLQVFVLGGVVHKGPPRPIEIQDLRDAMRIQRTAKEIKLEHVAKGDFIQVLSSAKLRTFLRWIADNNLMIHYNDMDPMYWSIVDIVDSILSELRDPVLLHYNALLKSDLLAVLRCNLPATIDLFRRYGYPDLKPEGRRPFIDALIEMVDRASDVLEHMNAMMLKGILQLARRLSNLAFIEGYDANVLIDNFGVFYMARVALFWNAHHVLDKEPSIWAHFQQEPLIHNGAPLEHYRFADSVDEPGIQLADIVTGLIGKMLTYFSLTSPSEVAAARDSLNPVARENQQLLRDLLSAGDAENRAFFHHVASLHDVSKVDLFLQFEDGAHRGQLVE